MIKLIAVCLFALPTFAAVVQKPISYDIGKTKFESVLVYDHAVKTPRPAVLLTPNWLGINPANLKQAELVAGSKYVVLVADVFGKTTRPKTMDEAGKASSALKADRKTLREREVKALEQLNSQKLAAIDTKKQAAIGFCFGGTAALELARTGAELAAVVTFHGGLDSPTPEDGKNIKAKILALHGADDPFVPAKDVEAFEAELRAAKVDWQVVQYGNAVHSFTDPDANMAGKAMYNPSVAKRAYVAMNTFFDELFTP